MEGWVRPAKQAIPQLDRAMGVASGMSEREDLVDHVISGELFLSLATQDADRVSVQAICWHRERIERTGVNEYHGSPFLG